MSTPNDLEGAKKPETEGSCMEASSGKVNELDKDCNYDFSYLPQPVWVKVMEFLSLSDRYHVSMTCHQLFDIFNHPANWKSAVMLMAGNDHNFIGMSYSFMGNKFKTIVEKFGHCFQRLAVTMIGHLLGLREDVKEIVMHMSKVCRLEHLVLELGMMTSDYHLHGIRPLKDDLQVLLLLVNTAFRLKKVEVVSWPMFPEIFNSEANVFEAMKKNPKLETLESLSLFWMKDKQWSERFPLLPSPSYTTSFISHFRSLQHLALRSPMLSDELIQELATPSRVNLLSLKVLLSYAAHNRDYALPEISSTSWAMLVGKNPQLEVEVAVMTRVPDMEFVSFLKPEVPLSAIRILQYARCSQALVYSLREKFKKSLHSFICYNDPSDCDSYLQQLVEACCSLDVLVFHGQISYSNLLRIAKLREHWKAFEFVEKQIVTESAADFDEDAVIDQDDAGDLVLVDMVRFHGRQSEEEREELLESLKAEVSRRMDYRWTPC